MIARQLADKYNWREIEHRPENGMIRFKRRVDDILDYWYTTDTVGTIITHRWNGRKQLFRKYIGRSLEKIFKNPRSHTGEGYYKRHGTNRITTESIRKRSDKIN